MIKPIETVYNGYKFRSRLEARWAVFFDAAGILYEYEPEGFDLGDGVYYLPDFYLPDFEIYVEIKPFDRNTVHHVGDGNKWENLCKKFRDVTSRAILLCYGTPDKELYNYFFGFDEKESSLGTYEDYAFFACVESQPFLLICDYGISHDVGVRESAGIEKNENVMTIKDCCEKYPEYICEVVLDYLRRECCEYDPNACDFLNTARTKARSARFEHGESGAVL